MHQRAINAVEQGGEDFVVWIGHRSRGLNEKQSEKSSRDKFWEIGIVPAQTV